MLVITEKFNCVVTFFLDAKSNQKNQGFSFNLDTIFLTKNHSIAFEVCHFFSLNGLKNHSIDS
jgi:hypothetical protein